MFDYEKLYNNIYEGVEDIIDGYEKEINRLRHSIKKNNCGGATLNADQMEQERKKHELIADLLELVVNDLKDIL